MRSSHRCLPRILALSLAIFLVLAVAACDSQEQADASPSPDSHAAYGQRPPAEGIKAELSDPELPQAESSEARSVSPPAEAVARPFWPSKAFPKWRSIYKLFRLARPALRLPTNSPI